MSYELKLFFCKKLIQKAKKLKYLYDISEYEKFTFFYGLYIKILRKSYLYFLKSAFKDFLDYISEPFSILESEVQEEKKRKFDLKGKFTSKIYVEIIGVPDDNFDDLIYFRNNLDRYPEILSCSEGKKDNLEVNYFYFGCHKLARDKVLDIGCQAGNITLYRILDKNAFKYAVLEKFIEEITELCDAKSRINTIEEIADSKEIFEVLLTL